MDRLKSFFLLPIILISFKSFGDDQHNLSPLPAIQTPTKNILATGNRVGKCITQRRPSYINLSMILPYLDSVFVVKKLTPPSIIVEAAGNTTNSFKTADLIKLIGSGILNSVLVGSLDPNGKRSDFSAMGEEVHITAPSGRSLTSIGHNGEYRKFSGTSGATPLVTGSLASFEWLAGYHPTAKEAKLLLKHTAIPVPSSVKGGLGYGVNGHGMVNAYKLAMVGKRLKEQYKTRCEDKQCVMDTEEILFGKSANDGSSTLENQSTTSPSSSGAIQ